MTVQTFCATVVPAIASLAYLSAGLANLYARNWPLSIIWLCYAAANLALIYSFTTRK